MSTPGRDALAALDTILAQEPVPDQDLFSSSLRCLSVFRDCLIEAGERGRLDHVNAVISVVMAGHFPLGEMPWGELRSARGWLAEVVRKEGRLF